MSCEFTCLESPECIAECVEAAATVSTEIDPFPILGAVGLLFFSAMFSGLTLGLMSLDVSQLELVHGSSQPGNHKCCPR